MSSKDAKTVGNNGHDKTGKFDKPDLEARIRELESSVNDLALTIDKVEDEKQAVEEKLKKALADYQNLQVNNERRNAIRLSQLKVDVAKSLMNVMDDIQYGLNAKDDIQLTPETESWINGVAAAMSKMTGVLKELGITLMEVNEGDEFDSNLHEAIAVVPEGKKGTIVQVVQPGYMMYEQVVRPAKVVVCK